MTLDWSTPVRSVAAASPGDVFWVEWVVPHWAHIVAWLDQVWADPMAVNQWERIKDHFNAVRPRSCDDANLAFRTLVAGVWGLLDGFEIRRRRAVLASHRVKGAQP